MVQVVVCVTNFLHHLDKVLVVYLLKEKYVLFYFWIASSVDRSDRLIDFLVRIKLHIQMPRVDTIDSISSIKGVEQRSAVASAMFTG